MKQESKQTGECYIQSQSGEHLLLTRYLCDSLYSYAFQTIKQAAKQIGECYIQSQSGEPLVTDGLIVRVMYIVCTSTGNCAKKRNTHYCEKNACS